MKLIHVIHIYLNTISKHFEYSQLNLRDKFDFQFKTKSSAQFEFAHRILLVCSFVHTAISMNERTDK